MENDLKKRFEELVTISQNVHNIFIDSENNYCSIGAMEYKDRIKLFASFKIVDKSFLKSVFLKCAEQEPKIKDLFIEIGIDLFLKNDCSGEKLNNLINHIKNNNDY